MDERQLATAAREAARRLAAEGPAASADGAALHCVYANGVRVLVRNSLQADPAFSEADLIDQIAAGIGRALLVQRSNP